MHCSLVCLLAHFAHSLAHGTVNDWMAIYSVFSSNLAHSAPYGSALSAFLRRHGKALDLIELGDYRGRSSAPDYSSGRPTYLSAYVLSFLYLGVCLLVLSVLFWSALLKDKRRAFRFCTIHAFLVSFTYSLQVRMSLRPITTVANWRTKTRTDEQALNDHICIWKTRKLRKMMK